MTTKPKKRKRRKKGSTEVQCPYCGETDTLYVDPGGGVHQSYVEDCAVCCRPRVVHVEPADEHGEVSVWVERGD
ncbi:CPXCG motif-containing cysteine-rich protein [Myxococcota bacterium]|nr:CPXCG motif-containing cysteine-rich protein [Myxococcota bacterium]